jgi:hypothetical protein
MDGPKISRSYSDKYVAGRSEYDLYMNKNVEWFGAPFVNVFYIVLIVVFWAIVHMSAVVSSEDSWTVTNMVHGVVRFFVVVFL